MTHRRLLLALCLPMSLTGCAVSEAPLDDLAEDEALAEDAHETATLAPNLTLSELIRRTRFGFREVEGITSAAHPTHHVELYGARIELTPFFPQVTGEAGPSAPAIPGAAIGLETVALSRGDAALLGEAGAPELEPDGSVTIPLGLVDEHLSNTEVGVEQSWTLHQAPGGEGELVVRIEVDGTQGYVAQTESGLHFEDPITGLGVSYGVATWIDANGAETVVMPSFEQGQIVIRIPGEVVDASAFPVLLDPVVSAENGVDNPVLGGAVGLQASPAIAFGPDQGFAVWEDHRDVGSNGPAIYGTRLSKSGHVLDPNGILVAPVGNRPDVSWDGTSYYVGWATAQRIEVRRFSPAGLALEDAVEMSALPWGEWTEVAVTSGASKNYVVFQMEGFIYLGASNKDGSMALYATGLAAAGEVVVNLDVSCAAGGLCVAAFDASGGVRVVSWDDGSSGDPGALLSGLEQRQWTSKFIPKLAGRANDVLLATMDVGGSLQVRMVQENGDLGPSFDSGQPTLPVGAACATETCAVLGPMGAFGFDPDSGFTWTSSNLPEQSNSDIAFDGADFVAVGHATGGALTDEVYARRTTIGGLVSAPRLVSTTALNLEVSPDVACDANQCLAVWQDNRSGADAIYGAFTSKAGSPLSGYAIGLGCTTGDCSDGRTPAVVSASGHFVTAYECTYTGGFQTLCFTSVLPSGAVVYRDAPAETFGARRPRLAAGPSGQLLAVAQSGIDFGSSNILGVQVDVTGGPVVDLLVSAASDDQLSPTVAYDGTQYVVAWEDWRRGPTFGPDIMGARVGLSGNVLDPQGFNVSIKNTAESRPAIASDGAGSVVVTWEDNRGGSWDIYGARIAAGAVSDANGISFGTPTTSQQKRPAIAWNGSNYQVAWEDDRNGVGEIYGRQITAAGVMNGGAFGVVTGSTSAQQPELAGDGAGGSLVVYQRFVSNLSQTRVRTKSITP